MSDDNLRTEIKEMLIEELMLDEEPGDIADDLPLFGPDSLGLDSVDSLQIVVAIEKKFGLELPDAEIAKGVLKSTNTIAEAVEKHRAAV